MTPEIKNYLSAVSANLDYLTIEEKQEIVEEILASLGDPISLAQAFGGNTLSANQSFNMKHLLKLLSFYTKTGFSGVIVLPSLSILSITLYVCSYFVVILGLIVTVGTSFGFHFPAMIFNLGFWAAPNILALPITAIFGFLFYKLSQYLWQLMQQYIGKISMGHQLLTKRKNSMSK